MDNLNLEREWAWQVLNQWWAEVPQAEAVHAPQCHGVGKCPSLIQGFH